MSKSQRQLGIGTALMQALKSETAEGFPMQVLSKDKSLTGAMNFFVKHGFYERLSQYEMVLAM